MRFRYKVAIFMLTFLVSVIGFNSIASPSLCLLELGKDAGYEMIGNYLADTTENPPRVCHIDG